MMDFLNGMDDMRTAHRPPHPLSRAAILGLAILSMLGCQPSARPLQSSASSATTPLSEDLPAQARQIILNGLTDADPQIRANAIEVVASTRELGLMPKVQKLLTDKVVPVRFAAAVAIGDLAYAPAKDEVGPLLNDPNPNVQLAAFYAISKLGQPELYQEICKAVASNDQTVRANAALLLGKSGNKDGIRFLYWTLQRDDSSDMVVLQAAESIAMLGDPRIYRKLWTGLISKYADDRVISVRAMGALGTDEAKSAIITMLDDPVPEVRVTAAEQLGKLGDFGGEAEVLAVFEKNLPADMDTQGQQRIKTLAALAIGEVAAERPAKYLPQLLQDPSKVVRLAAAKAVLRRAMKKP
ncbi:MAG: HEAT repeat domain-containing protein [Planctomycetes bacterium]|nr:HEAT repeat domain-containing protein [Planctomycetota bacterium]